MNTPSALRLARFSAACAFGFSGVLLGFGCATTPRSARTGELSVKPGINDSFKKGGNLDDWIDRFERESREIYAQKEKLADAVKIEPGMAVADIGAGTGFMALLFAERAGIDGQVYAVDISEEMLEHAAKLADEKGLEQIEAVLCTEDSVELPPESIDRAFICDTYHHFEYPQSTMATLHAAMRPGGELVVVDFIRIEGQSRKWVIDHVRAGQDVFAAEIESAGFTLIDDGKDIDFLEDNYLIRFRKNP